ncbi:MAG: ABC transporter ATP-binding protein [Flavobacteriaceae bacterium]
MKELQYLNKYLHKYRFKLLIGVCITLIARVFSLFAPRLVGDSLTAVENFIVDKNLTLEEVQTILLQNISIIIGTALLSGFFTFLMRQTIINVSRYIEFDLKNEIYDQYQRLSQRFYKNNRTGDLMSRISEDVSKVRMYFGPAIMYSINTIALFVIVIAYMFSIAPELALYTIIPLPLLSFIIYKLNSLIHQRSTQVQEVLAALSTFTQESFSGIAIIKSYTLQPKIAREFDTLTQSSKDKNMDLVRLQAWFFPLMILLIGVSNLIVIFVGGSQYMEGKIEIGVLGEFIIYVNMLTWPVAVVGWVTSIVQQAEASQKRINRFLQEEPDITNGSGQSLPESLSLEFDNVSLSYPETGIKALDKVSFTLQPGQKLGIVGSVGAGKSSLFDLLCRLYDPDEGTIRLGGVDIKNLTLTQLRKNIGIVPQNPFLFSETIAANIRFGKGTATQEEIEKAAMMATVHHNIIDFAEGYETLLGERGVTLSGGQIQRVSIARALIKNPEILLLDDCLSAVDTDTEEKILSNLKENRQQKTTLVISHRLTSVMDADQILVLQDGKIIQSGTHIVLANQPGYYQELFNKQQTENAA